MRVSLSISEIDASRAYAIEDLLNSVYLDIPLKLELLPNLFLLHILTSQFMQVLLILTIALLNFCQSLP